MAVLAIELNDAGIRAAKDTEPGMEAFPASPGIALWDGDTLVTGREAARRARLRPRWAHDRFWQELDTACLPPPFPSSLRRADLAHAHLEAIWGETRSNVDEVILAVPGSFSTEQLGLLLGVARSCQIPVSGMVDHAVAASLLAAGGGNLLHLDLHLHRTVATKVKKETSLERTEILVDDAMGMARLLDAWVKLIAQTFVRATRFDPLHRGETEQALYERLPAWLRDLRQKESAVLAMRGADKEYSVELTREHIVSAAQPFFERTARLVRSSQKAGERTVLLLTPAVSELPGMMDLLKRSDVEMICLPAAAGAMGALKMNHAIRAASHEASRGEALPFITRLALATPPRDVSKPRGRWAPPPIQAGTAARALPTHVLCDGLAHAIDSQPLVVGSAIPAGARGIDLGALTGSTAGISRSHCTIQAREGLVVLEDHSRYGTFLNDNRVDGKAALAAGDRLRVGTPGIELRLIKLADSHGTSKN